MVRALLAGSVVLMGVLAACADPSNGDDAVATGGQDLVTAGFTCTSTSANAAAAAASTSTPSNEAAVPVAADAGAADLGVDGGSAPTDSDAGAAPSSPILAAAAPPSASASATAADPPLPATFTVTATSNDATTVEGTLSEEMGITLFSCRAPAAHTPGAADVVFSCLEKTQSLHEGRYKIAIVRGSEGGFEATLTRNAGESSIALGCSTGLAGALRIPTFVDVKPLLQNNCSRCHSDEFTSVTKVKAKRSRMLGKLSSGAMPRGNPGFKDTADGQTVIHFLTSSAELQ